MNMKALLISGAVVTAAASSAQANTRLLVNCFFPPQHFVCKEILPQWKDAVQKATDGRVKINFPAQSMAPPPDQLASVRSGVFDAALQFNGFIANEVPGTQLAMMPLTGTLDAQANSVAYWRTYTAMMGDKSEFAGVKLLGLFAAPGADFYSLNDTPITSFKDTLDRKMWALPGVVAETLKTNGGSVVSGPAVQMTEIVQRGVVDGFVGVPASDAKAYNVLPYAKSMTQTKRKIFAPAFSFVMSEQKWDEISPEDQAAIEKVSGEEFARLAGGVWGGVEKTILGEVGGKTKVIEADPAFEAELDAATKGYTQAWIDKMQAAGFDATAALEDYRQQVSDLSQH